MPETWSLTNQNYVDYEPFQSIIYYIKHFTECMYVWQHFPLLQLTCIWHPNKKKTQSIYLQVFDNKQKAEFMPWLQGVMVPHCLNTLSFTWVTQVLQPICLITSTTNSHDYYLRHPPPVHHLRLQTHDFCRQSVDLLLRPDGIAEVHFITVETLTGPPGARRERGNRRRGSGGGGGGDGQHRQAGGGRLRRLLQGLDFFLEETLPSFEVTDLHLGTM